MLDEDHYSCKCGYEISVLDVLNKLVGLVPHYIPSTKEIVCGECGNKYEKPIQIERFRCPECRALMEEVRIEDVPINVGNVSGGTLQIMGAPYKTPIHSDSLALSPDQVAQHRKDYPYIDIDDEYRPVFTNAKDHDRYMKECGVVKQKSSNRKRGTIFSIPGTNCHRARDMSK